MGYCTNSEVGSTLVAYRIQPDLCGVPFAVIWSFGETPHLSGTPTVTPVLETTRATTERGSTNVSAKTFLSGLTPCPNVVEVPIVWYTNT